MLGSSDGLKAKEHKGPMARPTSHGDEITRDLSPCIAQAPEFFFFYDLSRHTKLPNEAADSGVFGTISAMGSLECSDKPVEVGARLPSCQ